MRTRMALRSWLRLVTLCFAWLAAAGLATGAVGLGGCAARDVDDAEDPDAEPNDGRPRECERRALRCENGSWQACQGGRWRVKQVCGSLACDRDLGCVDCNPYLPTACDGDDIRACDTAGHYGDYIQGCDPGQCKGGQCANSCGHDADLIYLVDQDFRLLSFNPRGGKNEIKLIGNLSCPAGNSWDGGVATPFSMSVDRDATAWVLYNSGEIFWVSTKDASCKPSGFMPGQMGFETFGMGFVTDAVGTDSESLYITGGSHLTPGKGNVGSIDKKTLTVTPHGPLPVTEYGPELTGTGRGELYAYFPGSTSFVARLDKSSGMPVTQWSLTPLSETVRAWAFAHWGGRFYIFVTTLDPMTGQNNSQVLLFSPMTGTATPLLDHLPYTIVGAGVSTCAPILIG